MPVTAAVRIVVIIFFVLPLVGTMLAGILVPEYRMAVARAAGAGITAYADHARSRFRLPPSNPQHSPTQIRE